MNNPYPPNADATQAGLMTPTQVNALATAQTDATQAKTWSDPAASKTMGNSGTTQTFAGIIVNFIRAVAATLVLKSSLGAGSTDVCVSVGPETSDGSTHGSSKLFRVVTGNGTGSEVEKFYVTKDYIGLDMNNKANTRSIVIQNVGAGLTGILLRLASGGDLAFGETTNTDYWGNNHFSLKSVNRMLRFNVTGNAYAPGRPQAILIDASYEADKPVLRVCANTALHTGAIVAFSKQGTDVSAVQPNGEFESFVAGAGVVLRSPNGSRWRITVDNSGALGVVAA